MKFEVSLDIFWNLFRILKLPKFPQNIPKDSPKQLRTSHKTFHELSLSKISIQTNLDFLEGEFEVPWFSHETSLKTTIKFPRIFSDIPLALIWISLRMSMMLPKIFPEVTSELPWTQNFSKIRLELRQSSLDEFPKFPCNTPDLPSLLPWSSSGAPLKSFRNPSDAPPELAGRKILGHSPDSGDSEKNDRFRLFPAPTRSLRLPEKSITKCKKTKGRRKKGRKGKRSKG